MPATRAWFHLALHLHLHLCTCTCRVTELQSCRVTELQSWSCSDIIEMKAKNRCPGPVWSWRQWNVSEPVLEIFSILEVEVVGCNANYSHSLEVEVVAVYNCNFTHTHFLSCITVMINLPSKLSCQARAYREPEHMIRMCLLCGWPWIGESNALP